MSIHSNGPRHHGSREQNSRNTDHLEPKQGARAIEFAVIHIGCFTFTDNKYIPADKTHGRVNGQQPNKSEGGHFDPEEGVVKIKVDVLFKHKDAQQVNHQKQAGRDAISEINFLNAFYLFDAHTFAKSHELIYHTRGKCEGEQVMKKCHK